MKYLTLALLLLIVAAGAQAGVTPVAQTLTVDQFQARQINALKQQIRDIKGTLDCYQNVAQVTVVTREDDGLEYLAQAEGDDPYVDVVTMDKDCE